MINEILIYVINGLIIINLILYLLLVIFNRRKSVDNITGFDATKDLLSEYDRINIIEGNSYFSFYNIKRKIIKLSKKDYYGNDVSALSLSMIESGISVNDSKFINIFSKIIPTLKIINLFWLISLFINYISVNISDAKIGLFIIGIIIIIRYLYISILNNSYNFISENIKKIKGIKKENSNNILNFVSKTIVFNKMQFIAEILIIIRMVAIILNM